MCTITIIDPPIDVCDIYKPCDQMCTNYDGGYACSCRKGYRLQSDFKTCRPIGKSAALVRCLMWYYTYVMVLAYNKLFGIFMNTEVCYIIY